MGPWTAIRTCFRKSFRGRARRAEYWWFALFFVTVIAVLVIYPIPGIAGFALLLAVFLPLFAVGARRMHDIGRPGALYLIGPAVFLGYLIFPPQASMVGPLGAVLLPILALAFLGLHLVWTAWPSQPDNAYGPNPLETPEDDVSEVFQ